MHRFGALSLAITAAIVLSACGDALTPPAAVVDGREITQRTLDHQLELVLADPQLAPQLKGAGAAEQKKTLTRRLLGILIEQQVITRYAIARRISVTDQEIESRLGSAIDQIGGQERFHQELIKRHLTITDVRANIEQGILVEKVQRAVVGDQPTSDQGGSAANDAFVAWLQDRLRAADIKVNPRYGRYDLNSGQVVPITSTGSLP